MKFSIYYNQYEINDEMRININVDVDVVDDDDDDAKRQLILILLSVLTNELKVKCSLLLTTIFAGDDVKYRIKRMVETTILIINT